MDDPRKSYRLFALANHVSVWRRKMFPAGTWREVFYTRCIRPLGVSAFVILQAIRRQRSTPKNAEAIQPFDPTALPPCEKIERILIIKADHIGDFVFALPAFTVMRTAFAKAHITLLCGAWNHGLAEASGLFDDIACINIYQQRSQTGTRAATDNMFRPLEHMPVFDIAIDLKYEPDTRFLLGLIRARFKAGFASPLMPDAMHLVMPLFSADTLPMRTRLLILAQAVIAGFDGARITRTAMRHIAAHADGQPPSSARRPLIGINMGSGATTRNWPLDSYIRLGRRLIADCGATLVLFGTQAEKSDATQMIAAIGAASIIDCTSTLPLTEFAHVVGGMDLYIGHDTGATHIAAALDTPTICLFSGAGILEKVGPTGQNIVVLRHEVPCMNCGLRDIRDCHHQHQCMTGITVDAVMAAIKPLVKPASAA